MKVNIKGIKENLKFILLHSNNHYDLTIYRIVESGCLDFFLTEIDNVPVTDFATKTTISANEQIIKLLDRLIIILKKEFIGNLPIQQEVIIKTIITSNQQKVKQYLKLKYCLNHSDYSNVINKQIYEIIVSNFCKNSQYVPALKELFRENNINLDKLDAKTLNKVRHILKEIVECNKNEVHTMYLFSDISYIINNEIDFKQNIDYIQNKIIENYVFKYSILLNNYYNRKKYLKYLD